MGRGWKEVTVGEVVNVISGKHQREVISDSGSYPIYGSGGQIGLANEYLSPAGSTIIGRKGTINTPIFMSEPFWNIDTAFGMKPDNAVLDDRLFYYFCESFNFSALDKSTAVPSLAKRDIKKITIPLPPLPEQRAIVAKLELLLGELDRSVGELEVARGKLGVYRASVLKEGFSGRLTEGWRGENEMKKEHIFQILHFNREEYLLSELSAWESKFEKWKKEGGKGKKPRKPSKYKKVKEVPEEIIDLLAAIPDSWQYYRMEEVAVDMCLGKMLDKQKNQGVLMPYLGNINVRWGSFRLDTLKEMRVEPSEINRYKAIKGDLVICEGGEPGRCAIWNSDKEMIIQKALHRVRFSDKSMDVSFVFYYMKFVADIGLLANFFTGTTIKHLTGKGLSDVPIPLPSLPEQHQIVSEIESRLSVADGLEREILGALERVKGLRMGILKKAFGGELVSDQELKNLLL